jgi:3-phosphoshikimate 1-carboxyvinyltransferase
MENTSFHDKKKGLEIIPITHKLNASVHIPGSKSITNRVLLVAALAKGASTIKNALFSDDSIYLANALKILGFDIELNSPQAEMRVTGLGGHIPAQEATLFIGNAGTAARFLTAFLTLGHGKYVIDGDSRMRERPIGDLISALKRLGARFDRTEFPVANSRLVCPPVVIQAAGLVGGNIEVAGDISSQFLSGLLMIAPYASSPVEIMLSTDLISTPYVELTINIMHSFGVDITRWGYNHFLINPACYQSQSIYTVESDATAASYMFAAAAILGGSIRVNNIAQCSKQGDIGFLEILKKMGCLVFEGVDYIGVTGPDYLVGVDVDMRDISDTAQTLAAIAPFAISPTNISGIGFIRRKETDRIANTCAELNRLGVITEERLDGMTIYPCQTLHPASIHTYNDHRMAMAFALIGLRASGVIIEDPACVSKTFPGYFEVLELLR